MLQLQEAETKANENIVSYRIMVKARKHVHFCIKCSNSDINHRIFLRTIAYTYLYHNIKFHKN